MKLKSLARTAVCGLAYGLWTAAPISAQPADDNRVAELLAAARGQVAQPVAPDAPTVDLGLEEAVALALEKNLDIALERLNPPTYDLTVAGLQSAYRPMLTSTVGQNSIAQLPRNQLVGGQRVQDSAGTYNFGASQSFPWGGGSLALSWNNRRQDSTSSFNTFNPQYNSTFSAALVQPLLRNRATDPLRTQIRITQVNRAISELQLQTTITNTVADVRNAYWDLVFARQAVEVARQYLGLAERLVSDNKVRVEVGALAPIDVVAAEAEAATRRQLLAQAEATWRTAELVLKQLIVSGTDDPRWRARLHPADRPTLTREPIDLERALRNALANRTDLAQVKRTIDANDLTLRLLKNQSLPAVDLQASYGLQGIGGTQFIRDGGIGGAVVGTIPGGYGDALNALVARDYPTWAVLLQISYPIGETFASANYQRARIARQQTEVEREALELQVATEVTNAALQVESSLKRIDAATAARELAHKRLEAEQSKFDVGLSTNFFVVQAQRDLADAAITELRAELDYRKALVDFERAQLTSIGGISLSTGAAGGTGGGATGGGSVTGSAGAGGGPGGGGTF